MGWGCYKHEWDIGSEECQKEMEKLCNEQLEKHPGTWGRDLGICPLCYRELERIAQELSRFRDDVGAAIVLASTLGFVVRKVNEALDKLSPEAREYKA